MITLYHNTVGVTMNFLSLEERNDENFQQYSPPREKKSALLHRNLSDLARVTQIKCVHCSAETHLTQLNCSLINEMK